MVAIDTIEEDHQRFWISLVLEKKEFQQHVQSRVEDFAQSLLGGRLKQNLLAQDWPEDWELIIACVGVE